MKWSWCGCRWVVAYLPTSFPVLRGVTQVLVSESASLYRCQFKAVRFIYLRFCFSVFGIVFEMFTFVNTSDIYMTSELPSLIALTRSPAPLLPRALFSLPCECGRKTKGDGHSVVLHGPCVLGSSLSISTDTSFWLHRAPCRVDLLP